MRLSLNMADRPRYLITLGDTCHTPENLDRLRLIPLARPEATIAAVRYVQIPQWKEMGIKAAHVQLSIGHADLIATLGDESFAAAAYPRFMAHAHAIAAELEQLCEPGATLEIAAITGFNEWKWEVAFHQCLEEMRQVR
ncbi:hypothetical protein [Armatimonas sp.]|uniref:hypothetical protein n=1 Tax=Armatimonas sp. TaxID=1872638 RepID=UPI00286D0E15|nr:hypothetical protein [Armatimonas sp.]